MIEWIRFIAGGLLIVFGVLCEVMSVLGVYKMKFVLNRMHAAAIGDTLAVLFVLMGLIILNGFNFTSLKLLLIIVFLWVASPVSSHLLASLTSMTNKEKVLSECEYVDMTQKDEDTECSLFNKKIT